MLNCAFAETRRSRGGDAGEFAGEHGVHDAGAGDKPIRGAGEGAQALGERGVALEEIAWDENRRIGGPAPERDRRRW